MKPWGDMRWIALMIVGSVLVLLTLGGVINQVKGNPGIDPGIAAAAFALLGAMVAGVFGSDLTKNDDEGKNDDGPPV